MQDLIAAISAKTGIATDTAEKVAGAFLAFIEKEAPSPTVAHLISMIPGADQAIATSNAAGGGGGLFGLVGGLLGSVGGTLGNLGDLAGLTVKLKNLGLDLGQIESAGQSFLAYVESKVGSDGINKILGQIPALAQIQAPAASP
jgi:hypothetical protein